MQQTDSVPWSVPAGINPAWRIGIVHSQYYPDCIQGMIDGAEQILWQAGILVENVTRYPAAGSFEVPLIGALLARERRVDGLIGLGVIVQGETHHARLIAEQAVRGIMDVQLTYALPFTCEILFVDDLQIARKRAGGAENKGAEAARTLLHTLSYYRSAAT